MTKENQNQSKAFWTIGNGKFSSFCIFMFIPVVYIRPLCEHTEGRPWTTPFGSVHDGVHANNPDEHRRALHHLLQAVPFWSSGKNKDDNVVEPDFRCLSIWQWCWSSQQCLSGARFIKLRQKCQNVYDYKSHRELQNKYFVKEENFSCCLLSVWATTYPEQAT